MIHKYIKNNLILSLMHKNSSHHDMIIGDYDTNVNYHIFDIEDGKYILMSIANAYKKKKKIRVIIESYGGCSKSADMIFRSLIDYEYGTESYVLNYAFSAGSFISMACDKLFINEWSLIGPIDTQIDNISCKIYADSKESVKSLQGQQYFDEDYNSITEALKKNKYDEQHICDITNHFVGVTHTHQKTFNKKILSKMGIKFNIGIPNDILNFYELGNKFKQY